MSPESVIVTVVLSMITALSSSKAWDFYKQKLLSGSADRDNFRETLKSQINKMDQDLKRKDQEIRKLNILVTTLTEHLSAMTVRVEFLEKENNQLRGTHGAH